MGFRKVQVFAPAPAPGEPARVIVATNMPSSPKARAPIPALGLGSADSLGVDRTWLERALGWHLVDAGQWGFPLAPPSSRLRAWRGPAAVSLRGAASCSSPTCVWTSSLPICELCLPLRSVSVPAASVVFQTLWPSSFLCATYSWQMVSNPTTGIPSHGGDKTKHEEPPSLHLHLLLSPPNLMLPTLGRQNQRGELFKTNMNETGIWGKVLDMGI